MAVLKHVGTADWDRERLNSWSPHALRTRLGMPSGPAALRGLTHVGHGEGVGELAVLGSRPHRWHCFILNVGKEGVLVCLEARRQCP